MTELGQGGSQGLVDLNLSRGIVEMVISPDDMGDLHAHIIHHHREVVGWKSVASQDDEVIQFAIVKFHTALNQIFHHGLPFVGGEEPDRKGSIRRRGLSVIAGAVIFRFEPCLHGGFPLGLQLLRQTITPVGLSFPHQLLCHLSIERSPFGLIKRPLVPIQT